MRVTPKAAFALLFATGLASPMAAETDQVSLFTWAAYIAPMVADSFQDKTGINITTYTYGQADAAESRLTAGGSGYDLVVVSTEIVVRLVEAGAIQKIDFDAIPNATGVDQELRDIFIRSMPGADDYVLPYLWGTTGIIYDVKAVSERIPNAPTDSWALIFDPKNAEKLADCGITIVDSVEEVLAAALAYLGLDPHTQSDQDIDAAMDLIAGIAPYVQAFESDQGDSLNDGEICVAIVWSVFGRAHMMKEKRREFNYFLPKEGINIWADFLVVPRDAKNVEQSNQLMDYMLRPDMMAWATLNFMANNTVPASRAEIKDPNYSSPEIVLPQDISVPYFFVKLRDGHEKRALDQRWRRLQVGH